MIAVKPPLREIITREARAAGASLASVTVMSHHTDPYRIDTPAHNRDAQWFAQAWMQTGARRGIHLRALHYALISVDPPIIKPVGAAYRNTAEDWDWLTKVSNRARFLGYIDFEDVIDERNAPPIVQTVEQYSPQIRVITGADLIEAPEFDNLLPRLEITGFATRQAYRIVFIGEKQSLAEVLLPIARRYEAELILPTGELSTTLLHGIASRAADDGRPCRIFYLSDFDPTGWHMPIEVSRKIQALVDSRFSGLDVQLRRCALTFDQVRALNLPSTPMKDTERRADRWRARWGVEQTEIDALATLRPQALRQIVEEAISPYWDSDLDRRLRDGRQAYEVEASALIEAGLAANAEGIGLARDLYNRAAEAATLAYQVAAPLFDELAEQVRAALPDPILPEPQPRGDVDEALYDSARPWFEQTQRLIAEKFGDDAEAAQ